MKGGRRRRRPKGRSRRMEDDDGENVKRERAPRLVDPHSRFVYMSFDD